jgi:hypothetical protein
VMKAEKVVCIQVDASGRLPDRALDCRLLQLAGASRSLEQQQSSGISRTSVMPHADRRLRLRRTDMMPPMVAHIFFFLCLSRSLCSSRATGFHS